MNKFLVLVWLVVLMAATATYSYAACDGGTGRYYHYNTICVYNGCGPGDDCRVDYCQSSFGCEDNIQFCMATWGCYDPFWNGCWSWACGIA